MKKSHQSFPGPIIDAEGHHLEFLPKVDEFLREGMGAKLFEDWLKRERAPHAPLQERLKWRLAQPGWWTAAPAARGLDRAAASMPALLQERLEEVGIDFMVLYTSVGLRTLIDPSDEIRRRFCWALNEFYAEHYLEFASHMTPAGLVPMFTPGEAISEIRHCKRLGLKVIQMPHGVPRPIAAVHQSNPEFYPSIHWLDTFGIDSAFDYDPVWKTLLEEGFAATFHGHSGHAAATKSSRSVTNYVFNHIGAHAGIMSDLCKSLLLGGVMSRFGDLRFAFHEGGVQWAILLRAQLREHWEKRNRLAMGELDPRKLDIGYLQELFHRWGGKLVIGKEASEFVFANRRESAKGDAAEPAMRDDFSLTSIRQVEDIDTLFENLYFGSEPDDQLIHYAYHPEFAFGSKLNALFCSDFGHWDAGSAEELVPSILRLLDLNLISEKDFRCFSSDHAIRLHASSNQLFWDGTKVEAYARGLMAGAPSPSAST